MADVLSTPLISIHEVTTCIFGPGISAEHGAIIEFSIRI